MKKYSRGPYDSTSSFFLWNVCPLPRLPLGCATASEKWPTKCVTLSKIHDRSPIHPFSNPLACAHDGVLLRYARVAESRPAGNPTGWVLNPFPFEEIERTSSSSMNWYDSAGIATDTMDTWEHSSRANSKKTFTRRCTRLAEHFTRERKALHPPSGRGGYGISKVASFLAVSAPICANTMRRYDHDEGKQYIQCITDSSILLHLPLF